MDLSKFKTIVIITILISLPVIFILPYLPLNPNDGRVIINDYKLIEAFPNLSFTSPVDFQDPIDDEDKLYIVEQNGRIVTIQNDFSTENFTIFLNIMDRVDFGGEKGLLGLTFHPNFQDNGYFYVDYTSGSPLKTVISRFKLEPNATTVDPSTEYIIIEINQPYQNHNGGQIAFGPDGFLYIALGDGGFANDIDGNGQNLSTLLGSILRIDIDNSTTDTNYSIPSDNPFEGNFNGYKEEIWAYGLRNPWRMSFDRVNGNLWVGDVGQNLYEEIDLIEKGKNYGWNEMEGFHCFRDSCNTDIYEPPIIEYDHSIGISVTGGHVYHGTNFPGLINKYLYADFGTGYIWVLDYNNGLVSNELLLKDNIPISSFGLDENGEIYICSLSGSIYKLELV